MRSKDITPPNSPYIKGRRKRRFPYIKGGEKATTLIGREIMH